MEQKILKAEVLITRRCNLKCSYCKVIKKEVEEMSVEQWAKAFDIIYNKLGASFIAIYGGEPTMLGKKKLLDIIDILNTYKKDGKSYTIISNSVLLDDNYIKELIEHSLDSWTASVDTISDEAEYADYDAFKKTRCGLEALKKLRAGGVRDVCGIITVHKKNIKNIPLTVHYLTRHGIWASMDVIHYDKGGDNFSSPKNSMRDLLFTREDMPLIRSVADELLKMYDTHKIFPTPKILEMWKDPRYIVDLDWKCGDVYCITVDSDGSLLECDATQGSRIKSYNVFDLDNEKIWNTFKSDYMEDVAMECKGCFWCTHVMAEDIIRNKDGVDYYQHKTESYKEVRTGGIC